MVLFNHLYHDPQEKDAKDLNKTIKVDSYEEMRKKMREMSRDYGVEIAGASVEIDGKTEYYILPAHVDGYYTNTNIENTFDPSLLPIGNKVMYHTHLTYYQPMSPIDSQNAYIDQRQSIIFTPNATYEVIPHALPKLTNDPNYFSRLIERH